MSTSDALQNRALSIDDLKAQRRWVLWRLETVNSKVTKVPYQPSGRKAMTNNFSSWYTYAECDAVASKFSGIGLVLGTIDSVSVWGVDIDACCDAVTGVFAPEAREIVIGLDSYGEYSPSGTGCHVLGIGMLPGPGLKKPCLGMKSVEVKADGYYFTFTGRHLSKTPSKLMERGEPIRALYDRVKATETHQNGHTVSIPVCEEERFKRLMAGDTSDYQDDHSRADFALCIMLAKMCDCNAFKIDEEFRKSKLYREKWERNDYRENTITRAILAVAKDQPVILTASKEEPLEDDGETEFLVEQLPGPGNDGWFPKGELSVIGAPSGAGKTSWAMPLLEKLRRGEDVWGHKVSKARDYRVLLHDRSKKSMRRTAKALHMSDEAMRRVIRLNPEQQKRAPAEILEAYINLNPGVEVWFIEGLDLWIPEMNKMETVAPILDSLQRIATQFDVAIIATVGAPKQKGKDRYFGRDALFGSSAIARKVDTVVLMSFYDENDPNGTRVCCILPRNGRAEILYFIWAADGLMLIDSPTTKPKETALTKMEAAVFSAYQPGDEIVFNPAFGPKSTFYEWRKAAIATHKVTPNGNKVFVPFVSAGEVCPLCQRAA